MARQEYSDPSGEAVARIEQAVDDIELQVDQIETIVTEIQNTDLANLAESVYSPLKYKPFSYDFFTNSNGVDQWYDITINGKGYIEDAVAFAFQTQMNIDYELIIDGSLYMGSEGNGDLNDPTTVVGVINQKNVMSASNVTDSYSMYYPVIKSGTPTQRQVDKSALIKSLYNGILPNLVKQTYTYYRPCALVANPIPFETSCVLRFRSSLGSRTLGGRLVGGVE